MNRLLLLIPLLAGNFLFAQPINWITDCSDKNFCLTPNACIEGSVFMTEKAVTNCPSPLLTYSYKIDLFNNNSVDIQMDDDTIGGLFPKGTHKVTWRATDNCGNLGQCTYLFTIKDCQPPNILCIGNLNQNILPSCFVALTPQQFIITVSDNCTPNNQLQFGLREVGDGSGFPEQDTIYFDICELGLHNLEIWVKDANNLTNQCNATVTIQDNGGFCTCAEFSNLEFKGCAWQPDSSRVDTFQLKAFLNGVAVPPISKFLNKTVTDSCFLEMFTALDPNFGYQLKVNAERNGNPLNGVSTFDLVLIVKHILGIQPFANVYQALAADVNRSNTVTTFDVVEIRKLILGIYDTFPVAKSWRFIKPFADPANFSNFTAAQDTYVVNLPIPLPDTILTKLNFIAIKSGDINSSSSFASIADDRFGAKPLFLTTEDRLLAADETVSIPLRFAEAAMLNGWQLALAVDPVFAKIEGIEGLTEENFSLSGNTVRALWFDATGKRFLPDEAVFSLKIKALQTTRLSQILSFSNEKLFAEAYDAAENRCPLQFRASEGGIKGLTFFQPRPNPFGDETTFDFILNQDGEVYLEMFDVAGKRVYENRVELAAGYQSLSISGSDLPGSGVFTFRIRANGEVFTGRLVRK